MRRWTMSVELSTLLALGLIAGHRTFTVQTAADCAPLICQSLNEWWDWPLWAYYGCQRPPCEIGG